MTQAVFDGEPHDLLDRRMLDVHGAERCPDLGAHDGHLFGIDTGQLRFDGRAGAFHLHFENTPHFEHADLLVADGLSLGQQQAGVAVHHVLGQHRAFRQLFNLDQSHVPVPICPGPLFVLEAAAVDLANANASPHFIGSSGRFL